MDDQIEEAASSENINDNKICNKGENQEIYCNKTAKGFYQKKSGTSALSGQLYETKLLSLILYRALYDENVKEFTLASNIEGVGALDDIVFRYKTNDDKETILFVQAKHRTDINKDKLTIGDLFKQSGDFNLLKYFDSYIKIKQKFLSDNDDEMFLGSMADIDHQFIILTSLKEHFSKKKSVAKHDEDKYLKTSDDGNIFQFKYDDHDIDNLISMVIKTRIIQLAKSLAKCILKENINSVMSCEFIKIYHVFLAHNVIEIESPNIDSAKSGNSHCDGKFRKSFLTSSDENFVLLKKVLYKEMVEEMKVFTNITTQKEVETVLASITFRLPVNFGNKSFSFNGTDKKKQKKLDYLCSLFQKLLGNRHQSNSKYITVKLNEDSISRDKIIQRKDLESYRLGGLIGNLLINDDESGMLKFNLDIVSLSQDTINILNRLKEKYDISKFRFDINVFHFPKLTLCSREHDEILVKDFLKKLKFYTNQAKEDEVEQVLKKEMCTFYIIQQNDSFRLAKIDALFLKIHDEVQKWWKKPYKAPYLTKMCTIYQQAVCEVLDSTVLNVINFIYNQKIEDITLTFETESIKSLGLENFISSDEKLMIIITQDFHFTSKKLIQYSKEVKNFPEYLFLDLDFVGSENCFHIIESELRFLTIPILVLLNSCNIESRAVNEIIENMAKVFKGKIILLTCGYIEENAKAYPLKIFQKDIFKYSSLSIDCRKRILEVGRIIFQGEKVAVNTLFDDASLELLDLNLLLKLINNEPIIVGETLAKHSNENFEQYINRRLCRYLTFNYDSYKTQGTDNKSHNELCFTTDRLNSSLPTLDTNDLVFTTQSEEKFLEICSKYHGSNIHWFTKSSGHDNIIWKQSYGQLKTIIKYLVRGSHADYTKEVKTLKDIKEKTVIVSAEPGMGKSVLLTHLAINTKHLYPNLWILNIKLIDHVGQFDVWKENNTEINLLQVIFFLYSTFGIDYNNTVKEKIEKFTSLKNTNEIHFDCKDDMALNYNLSIVKLFNNFYNNNKLALLLDGFDEICPDYADQVLQMLYSLKHSKLTHLWITTRPYNILDQLELALETFSYQINPLTNSEQNLFLQKVWLPNTVLERTINLGHEIHVYVNSFRFLIHNLVFAFEEMFMSIPLHLNMIAEIYEEAFKHYFKYSLQGISPTYHNSNLKDTLNLTKLYEKFTAIKFYTIRFGEKKQYMNLKDPDIKKLLEKEHKAFIENHKKIAAHMIFDQHFVLSEHDLKDIYVFIENIKSGEEKTGILDRIVCDKPKFVHFTFAEYFAVEMFFDRLKSEECSFSLWKYLINHILTSDQRGLRRFINSKLDTPFVTTFNSKVKSTVTKILLEQCLTFSINALTVAIKENLEYIARFLLQCLQSSVTKNNLNDVINLFIDQNCAFCLAIRKYSVSIIKDIIKIITDVDATKLKQLFYCYHAKNCRPFSPLWHSMPYRQTFDLILDTLICFNSDIIIELFILRPENIGFIGIEIATAAHFLGANGVLIKTFWNNLVKLNSKQHVKIFSVKDFGGRTPLHLAARKNDYDFFFSVDILLGREEFKTICTTVDYDGYTPICSFPYNFKVKSNLENFMKLLQMVYEESDIDLDNFLFNRLPKMYPKRKFIQI